MSTSTGPVDPFGWDEPSAAVRPPLEEPLVGSPPADPRFTTERYDELFAHDVRVERTLPWKQLLALLLVLAIVLARQLWLA